MLTLWKPTTDSVAARLRFLDGSSLDVTIPASAITGNSRVVGRIGSVVYLRQNLTLAALDLDTGTVTKLVGPDVDRSTPTASGTRPS